MIKSGQLKLLDFGFSKSYDPEFLKDKITDTMLGTPIYMGKK
jgi:serine/threonine protein kinase